VMMGAFGINIPKIRSAGVSSGNFKKKNFFFYLSSNFSC
jgi:hypothetical protein